jgi:hypothetical protein
MQVRIGRYKSQGISFFEKRGDGFTVITAQRGSKIVCSKAGMLHETAWGHVLNWMDHNRASFKE